MNVSLEPDPPPGDGLTVENHIWIYTSPIILIFGICTNILTIIVMRRPRMRGTSTSIYLSMLAVGDVTVVVVGLTPEWLHQIDLVHVWDLHPWVCRVEMYLYYTSIDFAIWVLMAFSCDRFIAVCFPLKKNKYCTPKRALLACGIIFLAANLNAHVFWTRGATYVNGTLEGNCNNVEPYVYFEESIRPFTVLIIAFIVPFFVIAISNVIMVVRLTSAQHMRRKTMVAIRTDHATHRMRKGFTQTTAMCLSACVAFLILVLPSIILLIGKQWWRDNSMFWYLKAVAGQLVYIHHSINFVLYSLTGKRFRRELSALFGRKRHKQFIYRFHLPSLSSTSTRQSRTSTSTSKLSPSASPLMRGRSRLVHSPKLGHNNGTVLMGRWSYNNSPRSSNNSPRSSNNSPRSSHYLETPTHMDLPVELSTIQEVSASISEDKTGHV